MTEPLSPAARALVDAARDGLGPDAAAIRRIRANITTAVGGGAAAGSGASSTASATIATSATTKAGLGLKLAILAAVAGAIVGAVVLVRGANDSSSSSSDDAPVATVREPAPAHASATATAKATATAVTTATAAGRLVQHEPAAVTDEAVDTSAIEIEAAPTKPTRATAAADDVTATKLKPLLPQADLAREVALVDRAMAALRDGDPAGALAATHRYDMETRGKGQLAEDAAAIAVEALCLRDDPAASGKLAAFDARWPHSAQRARVRATCKR